MYDFFVNLYTTYVVSKNARRNDFSIFENANSKLLTNIITN